MGGRSIATYLALFLGGEGEHVLANITANPSVPCFLNGLARQARAAADVQEEGTLVGLEGWVGGWVG